MCSATFQMVGTRRRSTDSRYDPTALGGGDASRSRLGPLNQAAELSGREAIGSGSRPAGAVAMVLSRALK